ncbi:hypothetical protein PUN28_013765 [Cardiocondyla obscurior]|uniref:Uncharacterized protein n=1 Tax=Cardiocondyla obscurior TaxID=286306 RepID=A0AAW2F6H3_9HYME
MSIPVGCLRHGAKVNYIKNFARPPGLAVSTAPANSYRGFHFADVVDFNCKYQVPLFLSPRARTGNYAISHLSGGCISVFRHFTVRSIWQYYAVLSFSRAVCTYLFYFMEIYRV